MLSFGSLVSCLAGQAGKKMGKKQNLLSCLFFLFLFHPPTPKSLAQRKYELLLGRKKDRKAAGRKKLMTLLLLFFFFFLNTKKWE